MKNNYLLRYQRILFFCVLLLGSQLAFAQLPKPYGVTPEQIFCTSVSLTLEASCSQGVPIWWDENGDEVLDLDVTISSSTIYYVTCEELCSCSSSNPVFVMFEKLEPIVMTRSQIACAGEQVMLRATCLRGVVEWFKNDLSTPIDSLNLIQTISADTEYLVRCNDSSEPCETDTKSVFITVGDTPLDPPTSYTSDTTICRGTILSFTATCPKGYGTFFLEDGLTEVFGTIVGPEVTTTYKVRCEDNGTECPSSFESFTITVTVPPVPTGVTNPTVCIGTTVTLTASCSPGEEPAWYLFDEVTPAAATTFAASYSYTYKVRCENISNPTCVSDFVTSAVTVVTPITSQPLSAQICLGDVATFTVGVDTASTFQWQKKVHGGTYVDIPMATNATLTIPNTVLADKALYRCVVTSGCTVYTDEARLTFAQDVVFKNKHTPSSIGPDDQFGSTVAMSDSLALVSAWAKNYDEGAVYVYQLNPDGKWGLLTELSPPDLSSGDSFGTAMAISGDTLFISAPYQDSDQGVVYIFARQSANTWIQIDKISNPYTGSYDYFGGAISVNNGTMAIGADGYDDSDGAVFIYNRNNTNGTWEFVQEINGEEDEEGEFGWAVGVSENTLVVGAPNMYPKGRIYIYKKHSNGTWQLDGSSSPITIGTAVRYGSMVSISGNNIIAASYDEFAVDNVSTVHTYFRNAEGNWALKGRLSSPDIATDGLNSSLVSIHGNIAVVGFPFNQLAKGAVVVFELNSAGDWVQKKLIIPSDTEAYDTFGFSVAVGKNAIVVGMPSALPFPLSSKPGAAYFYSLHTYPKPEINAITQAAATCSEQTATFNLTGFPSTDTYTITYKIDVGGTEKTVVVTPDNTGKASFTETLTWANNTKNIFITKIKNNASTCELPSSVSSPITIKTPTQITDHPQAITVCVGESAFFMAEAIGEGTLSFQWQRQAPATSGFNQPLNNSFSDVSMLTLPDRSIADNGARYRVRVFGECGVATSNDAMLTVLPKAVVTASASGPVCPGNAAQINFTGTPNAQVYYKVNNVTSSVMLNALGTATINTSVLTHDIDYQLVSIQVLGRCNQQLSDVVRVQVSTLGTNPPLVLTSPQHDVETNGLQSHAAETIQTTNKINTSGIATHIGNRFVILEPGFEAKSGSVYTARITSACP